MKLGPSEQGPKKTEAEIRIEKEIKQMEAIVNEKGESESSAKGKVIEKVRFMLLERNKVYILLIWLVLDNSQQIFLISVFLCWSLSVFVLYGHPYF